MAACSVHQVYEATTGAHATADNVPSYMNSVTANSVTQTYLHAKSSSPLHPICENTKLSAPRPLMPYITAKIIDKCRRVY